MASVSGEARQCATLLSRSGGVGVFCQLVVGPAVDSGLIIRF